RAAENKINAIYAAFTGEKKAFEDIVYANKRLVLEELFANAVSILASAINTHTSRDRRWRDLTLQEFTVAIRELMTGLPIYRTYPQPNQNASAEDRKAVEDAFQFAVRHNPRLDPQPLAFVRDVIVGDYPGPSAPVEYREALADWVMNFQ